VASDWEIAQVIAVLTNTLEAICSDDCENIDTYATKQKIVNKISKLIDKIDAD
jgi:hypothetical protein